MYKEIRHIILKQQKTNLMMPKNLFLVRHGQSEGNLVRKKFEDTGDISHFSDEFLNLHESQYNLTELGISQAQMAGVWLKANGITSFDRLIVSNNVRAMQTAAHLEIENANWMIDYNARERDGGLFNIMTPNERDTHYPYEQKFHDSQPFLYRPPQGESIADTCQRVKIILDTLARECDGQNVIIVCHGHTIRCFKIVLERLSLSQNNSYLGETWENEANRVPNCSIMHYTRQNPNDLNEELRKRFDWARMIRPAGGGNLVDDFYPIIRKKYSNEELLIEAERNRYPKK